MIGVLINGWQRPDPCPNSGSIASPRPLPGSSGPGGVSRSSVYTLQPRPVPVDVLSASSDSLCWLYRPLPGLNGGTSAGGVSEEGCPEPEEPQIHPEAFSSAAVWGSGSGSGSGLGESPGFKAGVVGLPVSAAAPELLETSSRGSAGPVSPA